MANVAMKPPHSGEFIRRQVLEPLGFTIRKAAEILRVRRATISDLVNGKTGLSPEMALRLAKAFNLRMQALYDTNRMRQSAKEIHVARSSFEENLKPVFLG